MHMDFLLEAFKENSQADAIAWNDKTFSYQFLIDRIDHWKNEFLLNYDIPKGSIVAVEGNFSPESISLFFALTAHSCIIVPLINPIIDQQMGHQLEIVRPDFVFKIDAQDDIKFRKTAGSRNHEYFSKLRKLSSPGLILFTSGSSGKPKAAVHNFSLLLEKFKVRRHAFKMVNILGWDHWGGLNTMLHVLSNGGTTYVLKNRNPDHVCSLVEKYKIEVLPASPTFLNLMLISECYKQFDLSSLKVISYGAEPMPESTLLRLGEIFTGVKLQQTYGSIEWGVARSKSKSSDSLWVKIGGEDFKWRVVDGILQIKTKSAMLGYLNAENPFTKDGWYITGDAVEVDGEYLKILGRKSEIINVGGEKVYPAEVENIIQQVDNIAEVTVYKEKNPITGNMVCAKVLLVQQEDRKSVTKRIQKYCKSRLDHFKVPVRVTLSDTHQHSIRIKKMRFKVSS